MLAVLCCTVLCAVLGLRVSTRVSCHPRWVLVTGPSICDVIVVTCLWLSTHWKLLPTCNLISRPSKRRTLRQLESLDAHRGCLVLSKTSQCHAKPYEIPPFTTSAPSHTPNPIWRPGPPGSTILCRFRPRESLPSLLCHGQNLRMFASSCLDRRRADPSQTPRGPATQTSWTPPRSRQI